MSDPSRCSYPGEYCLLEWHQPENCAVCHRVRECVEQPESRLVVEEIPARNAIVLHTGPDSDEPPPNSIMLFRANSATQQEIRLAINTLANLMNEVWFAYPSACTQIKQPQE